MDVLADFKRTQIKPCSGRHVWNGQRPDDHQCAPEQSVGEMASGKEQKAGRKCQSANHCIEARDDGFAAGGARGALTYLQHRLWKFGNQARGMSNCMPTTKVNSECNKWWSNQR